MRLTRGLTLTAAVVLLAGCNDGPKDTTANDLPDVVTTTTAAATSTPSATKAAATATPTPVKTTAPRPTDVRTSVRPAAVPTTTSPAPVPTTSPKPKPATTTPPPVSGTVQLSMLSGDRFSPRDFAIARGITVRVTNQDTTATPHDWTSNSGLWASGNLVYGQSYSYRFMSKGVFNFICTRHGDMTGRVTVG